METVSGVPQNARMSLSFAYDSQGRRISKVVSNWYGSAWAKVTDLRFVYDGWNLLGMLDGWDPGMSTYFAWGLDLSGSEQGAGGVGGLLMVRGEYLGTHYPCYDGNGNVMALVDGTYECLSALYEYGPFGELLHAEGGMALLNPFRFSTKFQDDETGLLYYGHRYLSTSTGRWLSRDPIAERGGDNLYSVVCNDTINALDRLGQETITKTDTIWVESQFRAKRIFGPSVCGCWRRAIGEVNIDYAYIKATLRARMGHDYQEVVDYIVNSGTPVLAEIKFQAGSWLGAGFGITFTPADNRSALLCCPRMIWRQRFVNGDAGIGKVDFEMAGRSSVDFPGGVVEIYKNADFGRSYLLELYCLTAGREEWVFGLYWGYHVSYTAVTRSATVTLDLPF